MEVKIPGDLFIAKGLTPRPAHRFARELQGEVVDLHKNYAKPGLWEMLIYFRNSRDRFEGTTSPLRAGLSIHAGFFGHCPSRFRGDTITGTLE
jgi:hypothetical protein